MEKLIELLNEYFDKDGIFKAIGHNDRLEIFNLEVKDDFVRDETVISKKFGFIKRLIDNDKIDLSNEEYFYQDTIYELEQAQLIKDLSDYLIMKLSISDNPIEDLISYLK